MQSLQCLLHLRYNILYFHVALLLAGACFRFFYFILFFVCGKFSS